MSRLYKTADTMIIHLCHRHSIEPSCNGTCNSVCGLSFEQRKETGKDWVWVFSYRKSSKPDPNECETWMMVLLCRQV